LIVLRPILLCADSCKVPDTVLVAGAEQIHAFFDVVVHMKGVNGESYVLNKVC
jgi:hypothetical protein